MLRWGGAANTAVDLHPTVLPEPTGKAWDSSEALGTNGNQQVGDTNNFFDGVSAESSESELRRIAPDHPVFEVQPPSQS